MLVVALPLAACGLFRPRPNSSAAQPHIPGAPSQIRLHIVVQDWTIVHYRVLGGLGPIQALHVAPDAWSDGYNTYYRLDPRPATDFYYLLRVPPIENGGHEVLATRVETAIKADDLPPAPTTLELTIVVENRHVVAVFTDMDHIIATGLYVHGIRWRGGRGILQVKTDVYPTCGWDVLLPDRDGTFTASANRVR